MKYNFYQVAFAFLRYNASRVRSLPLNQQYRIRYITKHCLDLTHFPSAKLSLSPVCLPPPNIQEIDKTNIINKKYALLLEQRVDIKLAKSQSQQFKSLCSLAAKQKELCFTTPDAALTNTSSTVSLKDDKIRDVSEPFDMSMLFDTLLFPSDPYGTTQYGQSQEEPSPYHIRYPPPDGI